MRRYVLNKRIGVRKANQIEFLNRTLWLKYSLVVIESRVVGVRKWIFDN